MAHESFEDREVSARMNETFISVKVDREERPDIDAVYMKACHLMTGSGGWPLTILMTPKKEPFFAATYIPRETRFGRVGMLDLTTQVQQLWATRRTEVATLAGCWLPHHRCIAKSCRSAGLLHSQCPALVQG